MSNNEHTQSDDNDIEDEDHTVSESSEEHKVVKPSKTPGRHGRKKSPRVNKQPGEKGELFAPQRNQGTNSLSGKPGIDKSRGKRKSEQARDSGTQRNKKPGAASGKGAAANAEIQNFEEEEPDKGDPEIKSFVKKVRRAADQCAEASVTQIFESSGFHKLVLKILAESVQAQLDKLQNS